MLSRNSERTLYRIYPPDTLETLTLRHRGADENQGTTTDYTVHKVRKKKVFRYGTSIKNDMASGNYCMFQFYRSMLEDAGAPDPFLADLIIQANGTVWRVEKVTNQLFNENSCVVNCECKRQV